MIGNIEQMTNTILKKGFFSLIINNVLEYYLGCSGWSYDGWKGPFYYPEDLDNRYWLSYYSKIFDFVEIDSTFYRIPSKIMVNNWDKRTPDNFKFAVKFPKVITYDKRLKDVGKDIERFYDVMEPLYDKILVFLIQLPPSLQIAEGLDLIKNLQYELDPSFRYAVEIRHYSWFNELFYNVLKERKYCLVWSQFEFSNQIGAFITYLIIYCMNPDNHNTNLSRDESDRITQKMFQTGMNQITPFLILRFNDFFKNMCNFYDAKNDDSRRKDIHSKKSSKYYLEKDIVIKLLSAFVRIYPRLTYEFEKILDKRYSFHEALEGWPAAIEGYRKWLNSYNENLKKQETCKHEFGKPTESIYGTIIQKCSKCKYMQKVKKSKLK